MKYIDKVEIFNAGTVVNPLDGVRITGRKGDLKTTVVKEIIGNKAEEFYLELEELVKKYLKEAMQ